MTIAFGTWVSGVKGEKSSLRRGRKNQIVSPRLCGINLCEGVKESAEKGESRKKNRIGPRGD